MTAYIILAIGILFALTALVIQSAMLGIHAGMILAWGTAGTREERRTAYRYRSGDFEPMNPSLFTLALCTLCLPSCVYFQVGVTALPPGAYARVGLDYSEMKEWAADSGVDLSLRGKDRVAGLGERVRRDRARKRRFW